MMRRNSIVWENLESRLFLSASTLASDQQNLSDAISKLAADQSSEISALAQDRASIKSLKAAPDPKLDTLLQNLQTDISAKAATLAADKANTKTIVSADQAVIAADQAQARLDHKDPTQLSIDNTKLANDRSKLSEDKFNAKLDTLNDGLSALTLITHDRSAIANEHTAAKTSPAVSDAQQQLINDTLLAAATIASDKQAITTDRAIVAQDLKAPTTQSTDLVGSFTGTVVVSQGINITLGNYPGSFDVTNQTATTLQGTLQIPGLDVDATGTFTGSIDADGKFSFGMTTNDGTVSITGEESFNGKQIEGDGIIFQFAGFAQIAGYEFDRM